MRIFYHSLFLLIAVIFGQHTHSQTYCSSMYSIGCSSGDQIENFSTTGGVTNISNLNSGCSPGNYSHITNQAVQITFNGTFNFTVQAATWSQGFRIWVDWNNDGDFNDPGEDVWNSGTSATTPFTGSITAPTNAVPGTLRMRVRSDFVSVPTDPCTQQTFGETEDYNIILQGNSPNDAGVTAIAEPSGSSCAGPQNVIATVENFGIDPLNTVTVNWEVGGNLQPPVTVSPGLVGSQSSGTTTANVFLGSYDFQNPADANIKAWTSQPNGVADTNNFNDTATSTVDINFAVIQVVQSADMTCADEANGQAIVTSLGGTPPFRYYWSTGDTGSTVNILPRGTHQILLIDGIGCRDSIDLTIDAPDSMLVNLEKGGVTCKGSTNGFAHLNIVGGQTPYSFNWSNGMKRQNINNVPPGNYSVTVTDDLGCTSEKNIEIITVPILRSQLDSVHPANCSDNMGEAYITANGGLQPYSYNWPGGLSGRVQTGISGGTYEVTVIDAGGCDDVTTVKVPELNVGVTFDRPTLSANFNSATLYQWFDCDQGTLIPGENSQDFTPTQPGNYALIVSYGNCTDTSGCHFVAYTSTENKLESHAQINVYPNPNDGFFHVSFKGNTTGAAIIELFDLNGKLIQSREIQNPGNGYVHQINENLASGMYILKVLQSENASLHRVVVK